MNCTRVVCQIYNRLIEPIDASFDDIADAMVAPTVESTLVGPGKGNKEVADPNLPVAQWRGQIDLGGASIDCYVLADGTRLLASSSAAMAISEVDRANLKDYAVVGQFEI